MAAAHHFVCGHWLVNRVIKIARWRQLCVQLLSAAGGASSVSQGEAEG